MEADRGKLFVGGIGRDTTVELLREYFGRYGEVSNASIVTDKITGKPRGFGFVSFSDASVLDNVLKIKHVVGNRTVEVKQALLREERKFSAGRGNGNYNVGQSPGRGGGGGYFRTKKIFVGGLPATLTEDEFREYFSRYGLVTDVVIMSDQNTRRPRGFGFISFENEDSVDRVLSKTFHELNGKLVEVKRAQPKYSNTGGGGRNDVHSGGYEFNGPLGADGNRFTGQIASSKLPPVQNTFPTFHPTHNYGAPYYNYGFSGYGPYGVGNYVFGPPMGAYQPPYMPVGYGTTSYEAGPVMASRFPSVVGSGNQGYMHGSYTANDVSSFSEFIDTRARSASGFNIAGGGGQGKGIVNLGDLRSYPIKDASRA